MGLQLGRDRLCLVQISDGRGDEHLVRFAADSDYAAPNLKAVLADPARLKLYHFARFDLASIRAYLGVMAAPVYCTKTASRLIRTYTDRHGLKDLVREVLGQEISKQQQSSDWGAPELTDAQKDYAASDVRYLHALKEKLDERLDARGPRRARPGLLRFPAPPRRCSISPAGPSRTFSPMSELAEQRTGGQARLGGARRQPRPASSAAQARAAGADRRGPRLPRLRAARGQAGGQLPARQEQGRAAPRSGCGSQAAQYRGQDNRGPAVRAQRARRRCSERSPIRSSRSPT